MLLAVAGRVATVSQKGNDVGRASKKNSHNPIIPKAL